MNVIDLHAFRVARAIKANSSPDADFLPDGQHTQTGNYVVWLPDGTDLDDREVREAAVKAHRERTGWTGPVIMAPPEMTVDEWTAKHGRVEEHSTDPKDAGYVRFRVSFEDGRTAYFNTPRDDLRTGDHVAPIIAREHQDKGELPPGKIIAVRRDPQFGMPSADYGDDR